MTDRVHSLTVVLEQDYREDDAEDLMKVIGSLKGVLSVTGIVVDFDTHMAVERTRREYRQKLFDVLKPC